MPISYEILLLVWLGFLGGCLGSFLNVVVYRLPKGESLVHPGSRCPGCGHAIRAYHNIPVLGWIMLRGRCHDCGTKIAGRYPLVEATVAAMFVVLALTGPLANGQAAMPGEDSGMWGLNIEWIVYAYYAATFCVLLALSLIAWDAEHFARWHARAFAVGAELIVATMILSRHLFGTDPRGMRTVAMVIASAVVLWTIIYVIVWRSSRRDRPPPTT